MNTYEIVKQDREEIVIKTLYGTIDIQTWCGGYHNIDIVSDNGLRCSITLRKNGIGCELGGKDSVDDKDAEDAEGDDNEN